MQPMPMLVVGAAAATEKPQSQTRQRRCSVHFIHALSNAKEDITTSIGHLKRPTEHKEFNVSQRHTLNGSDARIWKWVIILDDDEHHMAHTRLAKAECICITEKQKNGENIVV